MAALNKEATCLVLPKTRSQTRGRWGWGIRKERNNRTTTRDRQRNHLAAARQGWSCYARTEVKISPQIDETSCKIVHIC